MTRKQTTNVEFVQGQSERPWGNSFACGPFPRQHTEDVPGANTDTLYTMVWLDVSKEPWVLSIPDMGDRYYMMPMLDGWTNVFRSPGTRTTGNKAQNYAIVGPGWSGALPKDVTEYKSPSGLVWILGRIYCTGTPQDYAKVHALQDKFSVVPLSSYGKPYTPPPAEVDASLDMKTPVIAQWQAMNIVDYFSYLAKLWKTNPPAAQDAPMVARMAKIGLVPRQDFDPSLSFRKGGNEWGPQVGIDENARAGERAAARQWVARFWLRRRQLGHRLSAARHHGMAGAGMDLPADAVYPLSQKAANGEDYNGADHKYVLRFEKGKFPPVKGFWSLTMYDENNFLAANPLNR